MNNGWLYSDSAFGFLLDNFVGSSTINKFGINDTIVDTEEPVWSFSGAYTYGTAAETLYISGSSASDGNVDVVVHGLDSNFALQKETVTTASNPTTAGSGGAVALANQYLRIYRAYVDDTTSLTGNLYLRTDNSGGTPAIGNTRAQIPTGYNQTVMSMFTIPADYCGFITAFWAQVIASSPGAGSSVLVRLKTRDASTPASVKAWRTRDAFRVDQGQEGFVSTTYGVPLVRVDEKHDIQVTAIGPAAPANSAVSAQFQMILVPASTCNLGGITNL